MAKVAVPSSLPSTAIEVGGGVLKAGKTNRRKTPSELRGEQLKRSIEDIVDESPSALLCPAKSEVDIGHRKPEFSRNPKYIDTHVNEIYVVKKSRFRMLPGKENAKENTSMEKTSSLKSLSMLSNLVASRQHQLSLQGKFSTSNEIAKDGSMQTSQKTEEGSQSTFRSVAELSSRGDRSLGLGSVDMDKALKGLAARETPAVSGLPADFSEPYQHHTTTYSGNVCSEFHLPGQKAPLDFTLKTSMRVVFSSSLNWIHRTIMAGFMPKYSLQFGSQYQISNCSSVPSGSQVFNSKVLHSWVYPQSTLPPSLITALTSATEGVEIDFLRRRQTAWEDSFRSLYYMLRNRICNIFYVCTSHFVVMFTGGDGSSGKKHMCTAYISQSTRGLRSLLSENDICFSMPLCHSKIEQVTAEDLVELSEIEKHNLGQTRRLSSYSDVDNSPQSTLAFSGNKNVHGLYDFLLNYRSFLTMLTGTDVPVLFSPIPFQNSAISSPEIRCMEMKTADHLALRRGGTLDDESAVISSTVVSYSLEIKDAYVPPWIICNICEVLSSEGKNFEASFMTDPTSIGLNVAFESVSEKPDSPATAGENLQDNCYAFGIPGAVVSPSLISGSLKGLKFSNGSYTASLSPIWNHLS